MVMTTAMDEFFSLSNEIHTFDYDQHVIDHLTITDGYSQLLQVDPANDDYLRKFQRAMNELRSVVQKKRAGLFRIHEQINII